MNVIEKSTKERYDELKAMLEEYKRLYYTTNLPLRRIYERLGIVYRGEKEKYIRENMPGVDNYERGVLIRKGEWI